MPKKNIQDLIVYTYPDEKGCMTIPMKFGGSEFTLGEGAETIKGTISSILPVGLQIEFEKDLEWYSIDLEAFVRICSEHRSKFRIQQI